MNEQERREYLSSMGYEVYYPRFKLPGAKPSPHYDLPEPETMVPEAGAKPDLVSARETMATAAKALKRQNREAAMTRPHSPDLAEIRDRAESATDQNARQETKNTSEKSRVFESAKSTDAGSANTASGEELRFSLQFFAINSSLAVVNEIPHQLPGKESREGQLLLQAILAALLPGDDQPVLSPQLFEWPIAEGLSAPDPRRAAGLALQGFINQRQEQDGFGNLLVFSAQVHELLVPDLKSRSADEAYGDQRSETMNSLLTFTHSLQSMLVHPLLKRDAWAHMQALRQRLKK